MSQPMIESDDTPYSVWESFRETLGNADSLGIGFVGLSGEVFDCSATFARLLGRDASSVIGLDLSADLVHATDRAAIDRRMQDIKSGKLKNIYTQQRFKTPGGVTLVNLELAVVLVDEQPSYLILLIWDKGQTKEQVIPNNSKVEMLLQELLTKQPVINVNTGDRWRDGNKAGRDNVSNSDKTLRYLVVAIVFVAISTAWCIYYVSTTATGDKPEVPSIDVPVVDGPV